MRELRLIGLACRVGMESIMYFITSSVLLPSEIIDFTSSRIGSARASVFFKIVEINIFLDYWKTQ
jgi:hypothetical protein